MEMNNEQAEKYNAAMYTLKNSNDENDLIESAKHILSNSMDLNVVRRQLNDMQRMINESVESGHQVDAVNVTEKAMISLMSQNFANAFRMGVNEGTTHQKDIYERMVGKLLSDAENKDIGVPAQEKQ